MGPFLQASVLSLPIIDGKEGEEVLHKTKPDRKLCTNHIGPEIVKKVMASDRTGECEINDRIAPRLVTNN